MAAALLVVADQPHEAGTGTLVDLRVDRSDDPLGELRQLLAVSEAYTRFGHAVEALTAGDADTALILSDQALTELPGEHSMRLVRAAALLARGDTSQARVELHGLIAARTSWETIIRGFADQGLLPTPPNMSLDELLS